MIKNDMLLRYMKRGGVMVKSIFSRKMANIFLLTTIYVLIAVNIVNSENLQISTYYPAPYGGYVSILTTNNTWLARDAGNVGIGTANPSSKLTLAGKMEFFHAGGNDNNTDVYSIEKIYGGYNVSSLRMTINDDADESFQIWGNSCATPAGCGGPGEPLFNFSASGYMTWGNNSVIGGDQGGSLELGGNNGTPGDGVPYIDFHYSGLTQDYNVRLINDVNGRLSLYGNFYVSGQIDFCRAIYNGSGGWSGTCNWNERTMGFVATGWSFLPTCGGWYIPADLIPRCSSVSGYYVPNAGYLICCRTIY
ncbi:MAG: hypothetical protein GX445_01625 [Elusimicrobia bacterium]|nr:hypothetical protein [Elusimicrobiota bacterium]